MDWQTLLNKGRLVGRAAKDESGRTAFRILLPVAPAGLDVEEP